MKTLGIGVMGGARIAERSILPAICSAALPQWKLIAVARRSLDHTRRFGGTFKCKEIEGYETLLEIKEIDAVYLPLPTGLHEEWIEKCLKAGKHVLAEKSLAVDFASADRLVKLAREIGRVLMEDLMFIYHSQHRLVKDKLDSDEIGEIRLFRSSFGFPPLPSGNFRYNRQLGGGALLDTGCYPVRASQLFLGPDLKVTTANLYYDRQKGVDIYGSATLTGPTHRVAQIAFGFDNHYQCNYEIWGSKGKITVERAFTPPPHLKPRIVVEKGKQLQEIFSPPDNHFVNILKEFHRVICTGDAEKHYGEILNQSRLLEEIKSINDK